MLVEPLLLSHQTLIKERFSKLNLHISEYSFANLFLFRKLHQYQVIILEEEVFIKGITRDQVSFIMLTAFPTPPIYPKMKEVLTQNSILFPIPENWLPFLEKYIISASFKEEESDYLFKASKLAAYPGRHLSKKRNLVKQLLRYYKVTAEDLSIHNMSDALVVLKSWQEEHGLSSNEADLKACQEAIHYYHELNLHGRLVYIDQNPAGFIIGEWIARDCYVAHFSKALQSIHGLYQYLYQDLAQSLDKTCTWINLEQDLGIPSIRHAKHSYMPDYLLPKWRVALHF
jgi:uncharacterized protein